MLTGILNLIFSFINGILSILPTGTGFSTEVHSAFTTLGSYVGMIDPLVPIQTMLTALMLVFGVEIAIFGFKTVKWIISHIPWFGGKGNQ